MNLPNFIEHDRIMNNPENIAVWKSGNRLYRRFSPHPAIHKAALYSFIRFGDGFYFHNIIVVAPNGQSLATLTNIQIETLLNNQD